MNYLIEIKTILSQARQKAYSAINSAMVEAYWNIGKRIVDEEQNGADRAEYGKQIIETISIELTREFGKGFSKRTVWEIRQFYSCFPQYEIMRTLFAQLSWSHFQRVLKVSNEKARMYYLQEAAENTWSVRTLDRNISTLYYDRLIASADKKSVKNEMIEKTTLAYCRIFPELKEDYLTSGDDTIINIVVEKVIEKRYNCRLEKCVDGWILFNKDNKQLSQAKNLDEIVENIKSDISMMAGCIAGAEYVENVRAMLNSSGFKDIKLEPNDNSKEIVSSWIPDKNIVAFVASYIIEAVK